jgi:Ni/Co efflux regulator RcnB
MLKKLLVVLFATTFMATAYSVLAEDKKVDTENTQQKQNDHHSHAKDAKGVPQSETKKEKDSNETDTKQDSNIHPRDGK